MKSDWVPKKLSDIATFNPSERIPKGALAKKVAMDKLQPFCRDVPSYEIEPFSGGAKFRNGDTIMARITPCLENGKTAKVSILGDGEVGFGSTEYIVFRAKEGTDEDYDKTSQKYKGFDVEDNESQKEIVFSAADVIMKV